jgi:hypothetical protein
LPFGDDESIERTEVLLQQLNNEGIVNEIGR